MTEDMVKELLDALTAEDKEGFLFQIIKEDKKVEKKFLTFCRSHGLESHAAFKAGRLIVLTEKLQNALDWRYEYGVKDYMVEDKIYPIGRSMMRIRGVSDIDWKYRKKAIDLLFDDEMKFFNFECDPITARAAAHLAATAEEAAYVASKMEKRGWDDPDFEEGRIYVALRKKMKK